MVCLLWKLLSVFAWLKLESSFFVYLFTYPLKSVCMMKLLETALTASKGPGHHTAQLSLTNSFHLTLVPIAYISSEKHVSAGFTLA